MRKLIYMAAALLLVCACEKEIDFLGDYDGPKLVVSCSLQAGEPATVNLFHSTFLLDDYSDRFLTKATVELDCNGKTYTMTQGEEGVFTSDFCPAPGDEITLRASSDGYKSVTSKTVVPATPRMELLDAWLEKSDPNGWSEEVHMKVKITDPKGRNHYRITLLTVEDFETFVYSYYSPVYSKDHVFMGQDVIDLLGVMIDGNENEVPLIFDDTLMENSETIVELWFDTYGLDELDYKYFTFDSISEDYYKYLASVIAYDNADAGISGMFGESVCIYTNIDGGIGHFGAYSSFKLDMQALKLMVQ